MPSQLYNVEIEDNEFTKISLGTVEARTQLEALLIGVQRITARPDLIATLKQTDPWWFAVYTTNLTDQSAT